MNVDAPEDTAYEVLTEDQWRINKADFAAAWRQDSLRKKIAAFAQIYRHSRIGRALGRYNYQRGRVLAGGISFMALFSIAAAVTVAWTLLAHLFAANPVFQESVVQAVNSLLPGIMTDPVTGEAGLVDPSKVEITKGNFITGVVALVVALFSASRIVRYIRDGIRAMFGLLPFPESMIKIYPRFFLGLGLLTLAVLANAGLSIALSWLEDFFVAAFPALKVLRESVTFDVVAVVVPVLVNFAVFPLFIRYIAGVRVPHRSLLLGSAAFAIGVGVLTELGSVAVRASKDPIIAAAATVGTLLLWLNILARLALMICAWMANPPAVVAKVAPEDVSTKSVPNYISLSDPATLQWPFHPISGDLIPALEENGDSSQDTETPPADPLNPLSPPTAFGPQSAVWTTVWDQEELAAEQATHDHEALEQSREGRRKLKRDRDATDGR